MDSIFIQALEVETRIGITEDERSSPQVLLVSVSMEFDTSAAGLSDDIGDTINYDNVIADIRKLGQSERKTIECFAEEIAAHITKTYQTESVDITIEKVLPNDDTVGVHITRPS